MAIAEPSTPLGKHHHAWVRRRGLPFGLENHYTVRANAPRIPWKPRIHTRSTSAAAATAQPSSPATRARIGPTVSQRRHKCPALERNGDAAFYADFSDRYCDMTRTLDSKVISLGLGRRRDGERSAGRPILSQNRPPSRRRGAELVAPDVSRTALPACGNGSGRAVIARCPVLSAPTIRSIRACRPD